MTKALDLQAPVDTLAMEFTREFDAPVQALFRAHAEPDLVKKWLGPHDLEMQIEEWDFKSHGGYRYLHSNEHGDFWFNGWPQLPQDEDDEEFGPIQGERHGTEILRRRDVHA